MQQQRYATIADIKNQAIIPALDDPDDYDLDAIFLAAYEYVVDTDAKGNQLLNTAGFVQIVDDAGFWEIVEKNAKH